MEGVFRLKIPPLHVSPHPLLEFLIRLCFTGSMAALFALPAVLMKKYGNRITTIILIVWAFVLSSQIVYYSVFGTFYSIYSMKHGGQVAEFSDVIWAHIWKNKWTILLLLVLPFVYNFTLYLKTRLPEWTRKKSLAVMLIFMVAGGVLGYTVSDLTPDQSSYPHRYLKGVTHIRNTVRAFGLGYSGLIDDYKVVTGYVPVATPVKYKPVKPDGNATVIKDYNLSHLAETEKDPVYREMDRYFASKTPTEKNSMTGIFKGKNLIFITAESFADYAIDKKATPTLYMMEKNGWSFTDFYNPIWAVSTLDGEYVNLEGQIPKAGTWSLTQSAENDLPITLGHQFQKLGYKTLAYHDHDVSFYGRTNSHPKLGYKFQGQGKGYKFKNTWPESDLEMIDKTTKDFLTPDKDGKIQPFHVYYLTISGHLPYDYKHNQMAQKNWDSVKHLNLSENDKGYVASNVELDKAMKLLLERLKAAGELDNTVIVIAGDHYPYGLSEDEISEFRGHKVDNQYEKFKSTFIIYAPFMKGKAMDKPSSNLDILPTVSNMFGLPYDSRLMVGQDIFSNSPGLVIFENENWISDRGKRDSIKDEKYVKEMDQRVANTFTYSALMLDKDYYRYLKDKTESK